MPDKPRRFGSIHQALDELICAIGGKNPHRTIGIELWPTKAPDTAYSRLKASLDPNQDQKFSPEEVMYLLHRGRLAGHHFATAYLLYEIGYEPPIPAAPTSARVEIMEKMKALTDKQLQLAKDLELLDQDEEPPAVVSINEAS